MSTASKGASPRQGSGVPSFGLRAPYEARGGLSPWLGLVAFVSTVPTEAFKANSSTSTSTSALRRNGLWFGGATW